MKYVNLIVERLYRFEREAYDDYDTSKRCEILNKIINTSIISSSCTIGMCTKIVYGGIGTLIHSNSIIGEYCMIGSSVTIGAAPVISSHVYIDTGVRLVGEGIKIGCFSIIGANAVVSKDVPPFSKVGGIPAKVIKKITPSMFQKLE